MNKKILRGGRKSVTVNITTTNYESIVIEKKVSDKLTTFTPTNLNVSLTEWVEANREHIEELLLERGAILFRGFDLSEQYLSSFIPKISSFPLEYKDKGTPRTHVGNNVYTSTDYPSNETIELHNETAYAVSWPIKIFFHCIIPSPIGGITPIANGYDVIDKLDQSILHKLESRKIRYVRNFGGGLGPSLKNVFGTTNKQKIEQRLEKDGTAFEWIGENELRTWRIHPVTINHPFTMKRTWFNQITAFHSSTLDPNVREILLTEMSEYDLPKNVFYGDGTPIEEEVLTHIREVQNNSVIRFHWEKNDLLILDNMVYSHGRDPYEGERKVLVGMSDPMSFSKLYKNGGDIL